MPKVASVPFVLKDVVLTIDQDDYEAHVSTVTLTPTTSTVTWQGLTPDATFSDTTSPTWACALTYAQDWVTPDSLAQYLMDNQGTQKTLVFKPVGVATGDPVFTVDVNITPGAIGGAVNTVASATVTLGCVGAPVPSTAA